jgi:hypothetical protein
VGLGLAGVVLLGAFIAWEFRASEPILPMRLFRNRVFTTTTLAALFVGAAMYGGIVYLPVFLQVVTGSSATSSGLLLLPLMAGMMSTSILSGRVIARTGRYKPWPIGGMAISAFAMLLLSTMDQDTSRLASSVYMVVLGVGIGMVMQVLILAAQNAVEPTDLGVATSASTFFRQMGGSFGVAIFGAIMTSTVTSELTKRLPAELSQSGDPSALTGLLNSPEQIRALPPAISDAVIEALSQGVHSVFLWAVPVLLVGFVVAWFIPAVPLRETVNVGAATSEGGESLLEQAEHEIGPGVKQIEDDIALGMDPDLDPETDLPSPLVRD